MADLDGAASSEQHQAADQRRRQMVGLSAAGVGIVVLLVFASGTGFIRDFREGSIDRGSEFSRAALGALVGLAVGAAIATAVRRTSVGAATGAVFGAIVAICVSVGVTAAVSTVHIGPPVVNGPPVTGPGGPPATLPSAPPETIPPLSDGGIHLPDWVGVVLLVLLLLVVAAGILYVLSLLRMPVIRRRRRARSFDGMVVDGIDLDDAADSFDESAGVIDEDPDPRKAIIAAYAHLLERLGDIGLPRLRHEAPEEHLRRSLAALRVEPLAMETVTANFLVARFSTHPLAERDRDVVRDALRNAAAQLRVVEAERAQPSEGQQVP